MGLQAGWLMALRVAVTVQTATVFAASITAGMQLTDRNLHAFHSATSYALFVVVLAHVATAILAWRLGHGSARPLLYAGIFLAGTLGQIILGLTGVRFVHVPLGVLLFGASVLELAWIWMIPKPTSKIRP